MTFEGGGGVNVNVGSCGCGGCPTEAESSRPMPELQHEGMEEKSADLADQSDAKVSQRVTGNHTKEITGPPLVCVY